MLQELRNRLIRFMYGRNGVDQLNRGLLRLFVVFWLVQSVLVAVTKSAALGFVLDIVDWALVGLILFRTFSKDLYRRREENSRYLQWAWRVKNSLRARRDRRMDTEHKYFTCKCGAVCRVPAGKGRVVITCPKCGGQLHGKS